MSYFVFLRQGMYVALLVALAGLVLIIETRDLPVTMLVLTISVLQIQSFSRHFFQAREMWLPIA